MTRHGPPLASRPARALKNYRDPSKMKYVKLLDGAITDNFGVTGFSIARARSQTPYGPLTPREAVNLKRMLFMVSNAGREIDAAVPCRSRR